MPCWEATPRDEGYAAYHDGTPRCACPFPPNTADETEWLKGWDEAKGRDG